MINFNKKFKSNQPNAKLTKQLKSNIKFTPNPHHPWPTNPPPKSYPRTPTPRNTHQPQLTKLTSFTSTFNVLKNKIIPKMCRGSHFTLNWKDWSSIFIPCSLNLIRPRLSCSLKTWTNSRRRFGIWRKKLWFLSMNNSIFLKKISRSSQVFNRLLISCSMLKGKTRS